MTTKELYEWALQKGVEDYDLCAQYRDDGGCYYGYEVLDDCNHCDIDYELKEVIL